MKHPILLTLPGLILLSTVSSAQTATVLLREGDVLIGAPANHIVTSIGGTDANNNTGYVAQVNSSDGTTTLSHAWGTAGAVSPSILQTEGTIGPLVQTSFESFLGISNTGAVSYSASGTGGPAGGFDSVWLDTIPIAVEGDPVLTIPGKFWRFASRPGVTSDNIPYFVGGITSTVGGSTENRGLFYGTNPVATLLGGDVVPNLPDPLSTGASVSFDFRYSSLGTHYIVEVQMVGSVSSSNDNAMVIDTQGLMLGGALVQEDTVIPVSVGGDGAEAWDNFDYCGITETGEYVFSGDTNGDTATDEIIVINGKIVYREGDVVDGETLTGSIEAVSMNELGTVAYIWDIVDGTGSLEALFVRNKLILREGDAVDWDGDGNIDPAILIDSFTGIAALSLGSEIYLYFTADVDDAGTIREGLFYVEGFGGPGLAFGGGGFGIPCPCGNNNDGSLLPELSGCAGVPNPEGCNLTATGTPSVSADTIVLHASHAKPSTNGLFLKGDDPLLPGTPLGAVNANGLLQCATQIIRFGAVSVVGGMADTSSYTKTLSDLSNAGPGDTRYYQFWYRSPSKYGPCSNPSSGGSNTSNGYRITWGT